MKRSSDSAPATLCEAAEDCVSDLDSLSSWAGRLAPGFSASERLKMEPMECRSPEESKDVIVRIGSGERGRGEEEEANPTGIWGIWGVWGSEGTRDARSDTVLNACECNTGALWVQSYSIPCVL